ncbi:hypothetical protein NA57DRAFT_69636 [Rhizodiscina lignyota]|uniref:Phytanoyl-CoA hydroxylase n=1 Tax=Rhizodiscina lignyota TaxID=1504668 RepID=A0A9P4M2W8_9PEZI|nr:hypothetical protein NA57DRAFT_69636 [Rhizodiscina lignyota]
MPHSTVPERVEVKEQLYVNDGPLKPEQVGLIRPVARDTPIEELQRRLEEDGFLLVKGVIPREDVLRAREKYFKFLSPCGVLKKGTAPVNGIYNDNEDVSKFPGIGSGAAGANGHPGEQAAAFVDLSLQAHTEPWYAEDLCRHPALKEFVAELTGWKDNTFGLRRSLLRNNIPNTKAIGVHYDQIFLRYGEPTSLTAWVPIGDVSIKGGGLIYLENSVSYGEELEQQFTEKAMAAGLSSEEAKSAFNKNMMTTGLLTEDPGEFARLNNRRWMVSAYEAGDVVFHNPFAIHASTINHDPNNVIRLATDLRFVDSSRSYDKRWDNHYTLDDGV